MKYEVYTGEYQGQIVYVGEGKEGRSLHLNSGISHVYVANKVHFQGETIKVEIIDRFATKEEARTLEKELIEEINPEWNILKHKGAKTFRREVVKCLALLDETSGCRSILEAAYPRLRDQNGKHIITNDVFRNPSEGISLARLHAHYHIRKTRSLITMLESFEKLKQGTYEIEFTQEFKDHCYRLVRQKKVR